MTISIEAASKFSRMNFASEKIREAEKRELEAIQEKLYWKKVYDMVNAELNDLVESFR